MIDYLTSIAERIAAAETAPHPARTVDPDDSRQSASADWQMQIHEELASEPIEQAVSPLRNSEPMDHQPAQLPRRLEHDNKAPAPAPFGIESVSGSNEQSNLLHAVGDLPMRADNLQVSAPVSGATERASSPVAPPVVTGSPVFVSTIQPRDVAPAAANIMAAERAATPASHVAANTPTAALASQSVSGRATSPPIKLAAPTSVVTPRADDAALPQPAPLGSVTAALPRPTPLRLAAGPPAKVVEQRDISVQISIERVEVRASVVAAKTRPVRESRSQAPARGLEDYLRGRAAGRSA